MNRLLEDKNCVESTGEDKHNFDNTGGLVGRMMPYYPKGFHCPLMKIYRISITVPLYAQLFKNGFILLC